MSTLLEQVLTAAYVGTYQRHYTRLIAEGHGPDFASHESSKAAWAARTEREQHEAGNAARRKAE